ncbi:MAG TPA: peptide chain release factor 1 [Spirochaetia bacterium]|nr:peptide chain release factor 1 [Spirochaetia bacterium]
MIDKLERNKKRFEELETLLADPDVTRDQKRYRELRQEHASLSDQVAEFGRFRAIESEIASNRELAESSEDREMKELAKEELAGLQARLEASEQKLKELLVPKDPLDDKNVIVEIRAGPGGDEAALFAADLFRMYSYYADTHKWKLEIMSSSPTGIGGFKEIICSITGKGAFARLRYESGVHRVQRVPVTEAGGRIHTSTASVAVLPEVEETEIEIAPGDLRIDVMRAGGPGGQSVNTTDSAVRITHLPSGIVVHCQDEKSQHKNRAKALRILRARLFEAEEERKHAERAQARKSQIGTGERAEKIRTYNYPQNRATDHRVNVTLYKLDAVMKGEIEEFIDALRLQAQQTALTSDPARPPTAADSSRDRRPRDDEA